MKNFLVHYAIHLGFSSETHGVSEYKTLREIRTRAGIRLLKKILSKKNEWTYPLKSSAITIMAITEIK